MRAVAAVAGLLLLAGCAAPASPPSTVIVLAAASLSGPLDQVAAEFERAHPDFDVVVSYGGSSALAEQIVSGVPADLFFSANEATMATVTDGGLADTPEVLLTNVLEIAVPAGNPGGVTGLADLANPELVVALCDPAVPCGSAAARLFELAGITPSVDTLEEDVKAALTKVELGEVDAALVYVTDVIAAGDRVEGIEVPQAAEVVNRYPIALLADAPNPEAGQAFLEFVRSDRVLKVFTDAGFGTP